MRAASRDRSQVSYRVSLPGGCWLDAESTAPLREVTLRPVGNHDDAFLLDSAGLPPGPRGTALLARCLVDETHPDEFARSLTVGDRESLLLQLRRLTLGDSIDVRVRCPAAACGERMEARLTVDALLLPPYREVGRDYELEIRIDGAHHALRFRLPRASDLEAVTGPGEIDAERDADELLESCVITATSNGVPEPATELPQAVREAVELAMLERDPQAEVELELMCPTCGEGFAVVLDAATLFLRELDERATRLIHDVHALASRYHWSERAILRMPAQRRAQYLELLFGDSSRTARDGVAR